MVEASILNYAETIGILVGVVIALIQLRNIGRTRETELETRQAQLFIELVGRIHNKEFVDHFFEILGWEWDDFNEFWEKYGREKNPQSFSMFMRIQNIIESLGFYTKLELVDPSLTDELMSMWLINWWWEKKWSNIYWCKKTL